MNRQIIIEKRLKMTADEVKILSERAQKNLILLDVFSSARSVMIYFPIQNEVAVDMILDRCEGKKVFAPRVIGNGIMEAVELSGKIKKGKFGIEEPVGAAYTGGIDLYIVPGVIFSEMGDRVGRGAGYYDRFLKGRSGVKVGLCYSFQTDNTVKTNETDVAMDIVVTDEGVFNL
ncbi:MAG: 5-formyltetrahydrofolate cyclo-ligase [Clostridia bacterium]|nr:5-formyltetrahydrofolate cyclo-ligase [Clostridia bacterium]